jgi:hypothetical protein
VEDDQSQFEADLLKSLRQMVNATTATVRRVRANASDEDTLVLRLHKLASGRWIGQLYDVHGQETGSAVDYESPEDAERAVIGQGHQITHVVVAA